MSEQEREEHSDESPEEEMMSSDSGAEEDSGSDPGEPLSGYKAAPEGP